MAGSVAAAAPPQCPASPRIWSSRRRYGPGLRRPSRACAGVGLVEQLTINGSGQWVAVGALDGEAVAWQRAADGSWVQAWQFRPLSQSFVGDFLPSDFRLAGLPNGFVALDPVDPMTTWTSPDGSTWTSAGVAAPTGLQGDVRSFATGIARLGDTLLVAGTGREQPGRTVRLVCLDGDHSGLSRRPSAVSSADDSVAPKSGPRTVRAPRGTELSCKGWQQEAALRMLMNNLDPEVAEDPDNLIVYGGTGRAARSRGRHSTPSSPSSAASRTTRPCWSLPASRSASSAPRPMRHAC